MNQDYMTTLFCHIDELCKHFEPIWKQTLIEDASINRRRSTRLCLSEIMTIAVLFPRFWLSRFQDFLSADDPLLTQRLFPQGQLQSLHSNAV